MGVNRYYVELTSDFGKINTEKSAPNSGELLENCEKEQLCRSVTDIRYKIKEIKR